jgi:hypothetical protein
MKIPTELTTRGPGLAWKTERQSGAVWPNSQVEGLREVVVLFAKRHRSCGQLWLDVPDGLLADAMPRLLMACLCGDTLEEIIRAPTLSRPKLQAILRSPSPAAGQTPA